MSVFVDKDSKVIIQGFTGQHATFHAEESMAFGQPYGADALASSPEGVVLVRVQNDDVK